MKHYQAAIIGCGKIASQFSADPKIKGIYTHAAAYAAHPDITLAAVCDINETKAAACASQWQVPHYFTDAEKMLSAIQPDIVSICTPDAIHADGIESALSIPSVKGILVEKPLAQEIARAARIIERAKQQGVVLLVNYNRRYAEGHQKIKRAIAAGQLGDIKKVSGYYTKGIMHNGTHWIDLARWLIGDIEAVQALAPKRHDALDPTVDVWFTFTNHAHGFLHGIEAENMSLFEMDIVGSKGRIRVTNAGYDIDYFDKIASPHFSGYQSFQHTVHEKDAVTDTLPHAVSDLVYAIKHRIDPQCSGQDGWAALKIASSIIQSSRTGEMIKI